MAVYGIDLGTTNSLIALHDKGYLSDMIPSCADLKTGKAGKEYYNDPLCTRSYKVDMSLGREGEIPIQASACVLKELCNQVKDDKVKDVVISVPAFFSEQQRTATVEAAKKAGLDVKALVNEPTAAAIYITHNQKGLYVVFDLGGGTFDVSIIDSRFGNYDIQATDGMVIGGDNLDENILKYFVKTNKLVYWKFSKESKLRLRHYCTQIKHAIQSCQTEVLVNLKDWNGPEAVHFTMNEYKQIVQQTFYKAVEMAQQLINTYIPLGEDYSILLVGGSTRCPYLRKWIGDVLGKTPNELNYNPDFVVAQGAAYYAKLFEEGKLSTTVSDVTKALSIGLIDGTVDVLVEANSHIPLSVEKMFSNDIDTSILEFDLFQGDSLLQKNNELIGSLHYDYGKVQPAHMGNVILKLEIDQNGLITMIANELLKTPVSVQLKRKE